MHPLGTHLVGVMLLITAALLAPSSAADRGSALAPRVASARGLAVRTAAPAFDLHVNGTAGKPGGGSWSNASDRRLKKDIRDLEGALEALLLLRGVKFEYKNPRVIHELPGERIGMIAQEVAAIFPDWVHTSDDGYQRLTFRGFEALTVEALRELRAEKDADDAALRDEISLLREENRRLRERLERLETRPRR